MKNLLPILALLLLVGCTSEPTELERCIEANELKINYSEKYDDFVAQRNSTGIIGHEEYLVFEETLNRAEIETEKCITIPIGDLDDLFPGSKDWSREEKMANKRWKSWWAERIQTCKSEAEAKEVERVTKICHAQGIY